MPNQYIDEMSETYGANTNTEADIANLEKRLRCKFPADYKNFLMQTNGGIPKKYYFQAPNVISTSISLFLGNCPGIYDYRDLNEYGRFIQYIFGDERPDDCIRIADDPGGVDFCMGVEPYNFGKIFIWDHDMPVWQPEFLQVADSFDDFFYSCYENGDEAEADYEAGIRRQRK